MHKNIQKVIQERILILITMKKTDYRKKETLKRVLC